METLMNENMENVMDAVEDVTPVVATGTDSGLAGKACIAIGSILIWEGGKWAFKKLMNLRSGIKTKKDVVSTESEDFQNAQEAEVEEAE